MRNGDAGAGENGDLFAAKSTLAPAARRRQSDVGRRETRPARLQEIGELAARGIASAAPIAFQCAMSLGVLLAGTFDWRLPVLGLAAVCLALAMAASALPRTEPEALSSAPVNMRTYRERLLGHTRDGGIRLLLVSYFLRSAGIYVFLGLYPSWLVQLGLAGAGAVAIGAVLFVGETGGLLGALLSGWLAGFFRHPLTVCATAALGIAAIVLTVPYGIGRPALQMLAYGLFAFGRDLMLALMLGGAMLLVSAPRRGSLNAVLNAVYQTGSSSGGLLGAWLYGYRADFAANAAFRPSCSLPPRSCCRE